MLLEFSVSNFRSIHQRRTLLLEAQTSIKDEPKSNIFQKDNYSLLKTVAIYGANSSGKSNLLKAIGLMGNIVISSVKLNDGEELQYDPFLLTTKSDSEPTMFECLFLIDGIRYRYGFEFINSGIVNEWLFSKKGKKSEKELFIRTKDGFESNKSEFPEGCIDINLNENRLFLSLIAQLGGEVSKTIIKWFEAEYNVISGIQSKGYKGFSKLMIHKKLPGYAEAMSFFQSMQLGFASLFSEEREFDLSILGDMSDKDKAEVAKEFSGKKTIELFSIHNKYNTKGNSKEKHIFDFEEKESRGTNKLIEISGPIFDSLVNGRTLFIDELDAAMHPLISEQIIKLFNDTKTNPKNAQLIFTTHDTHLLSSKLLRRDQIWFTEKDNIEQTDLYSMTDIVLPNGQIPRNDSNYEKNYIAGRYGAIPFIR